jgi:hypothetical protein
MRTIPEESIQPLTTILWPSSSTSMSLNTPDVTPRRVSSLTTASYCTLYTVSCEPCLVTSRPNKRLL